MLSREFRPAALVFALVTSTVPALAHHGGGTFDSSRAVTLTGKLTKIDFINPHSWIYFDVQSIRPASSRRAPGIRSAVGRTTCSSSIPSPSCQAC
jgi:hypothetical protein